MNAETSRSQLIFKFKSDTKNMRAISLWQPWASAIAVGIKQWETRGRQTHVRGTIAIHAAQRRHGDDKEFFNKMMCRGDCLYPFHRDRHFSYDNLPFGAIVALADLHDCVSTDSVREIVEGRLEGDWGNYSPGRFVWKLRNIRPFGIPYGMKAKQGWFNAPDALEDLWKIKQPDAKLLKGFY